ncbi:hypothetical protein AVEN_200862-1 [Araneus ventricosus]|uniref:Uncharacterized protein n=1 Tax=Araneus ventricosus TaxID=182803 RepID=A0A4Y2M1S5_ARAVE|nr:hypothetical protein AVEN_200862-1 [Araneus ventricosus]
MTKTIQRENFQISQETPRLSYFQMRFQDLHAYPKICLHLCSQHLRFQHLVHRGPLKRLMKQGVEKFDFAQACQEKIFIPLYLGFKNVIIDNVLIYAPNADI